MYTCTEHLFTCCPPPCSWWCPPPVWASATAVAAVWPQSGTTSGPAMEAPNWKNKEQQAPDNTPNCTAREHGGYCRVLGNNLFRGYHHNWFFCCNIYLDHRHAVCGIFLCVLQSSLSCQISVTTGVSGTMLSPSSYMWHISWVSYIPLMSLFSSIISPCS